MSAGRPPSVEHRKLVASGMLQHPIKAARLGAGFCRLRTPWDACLTRSMQLNSSMGSNKVVKQMPKLFLSGDPT
jgi:hypothetical protein